MKIILAVDSYFIGTGEGTVSDRIYFYGVFIASALIASSTLIAL